MRRIVLVAAALALWAGPASAQDAPRDLTLRLSDLPPGYLVGDDGVCNQVLDDEGAPPPLVRLERRQENCSIELTRLWVAPGRPRGPASVEAGVFRFADEAGAREGFEAGRALVAYLHALPPGSLEPRPATLALGDQLALFETDSAIVLGRRPRPALAVLWRTGRVLSLVFVGGGSGAAAEARALALARVQQGRIERPTPLGRGANDDREVPLDNPALGVPVRWVGARLDPPGRLPALALEASFGPLGPGDSPGWRAEVDYRAAGSRGQGVKIGLWRPPAFAHFKRTRLGRLVWRGRCARRTEVAVAGGRALIYSGYARPPARCGRRPPDRHLAHVYLDGVVATLNVPVCFLCVRQGPGDGPYDSVAGLRAVARALRPRSSPRP